MILSSVVLLGVLTLRTGADIPEDILSTEKNASGDSPATSTGHLSQRVSNRKQSVAALLTELLDLRSTLNDTDPVLNEVQSLWQANDHGVLLAATIEISLVNDTGAEPQRYPLKLMLDKDYRRETSSDDTSTLTRKKRTYQMPCMVCGMPMVQPILMSVMKKHKKRKGMQQPQYQSPCGGYQCGGHQPQRPPPPPPQPPPCGHPQSPCGHPQMPYYPPQPQPQPQHPYHPPSNQCNVCQSQQQPYGGYMQQPGSSSWSSSSSQASSYSGSSGWGKK